MKNSFSFIMGAIIITLVSSAGYFYFDGDYYRIPDQAKVTSPTEKDVSTTSTEDTLTTTGNANIPPVAITKSKNINPIVFSTTTDNEKPKSSTNSITKQESLATTTNNQPN